MAVWSGRSKKDPRESPRENHEDPENNIIRFRNGDESAYEDLGNRIERTAAIRLRDVPHDRSVTQEDIRQDALVVVWENSQDPNNKRFNPQPLGFAVMKNRIADARRHRTTVPLDPRDRAPEPRITAEELIMIREAMQTELTDLERFVVQQRMLRCDYKSLANQLGVTEGALRTTHCRALSKLRDRLGNMLDKGM